MLNPEIISTCVESLLWGVGLEASYRHCVYIQISELSGQIRNKNDERRNSAVVEEFLRDL